MTFKRGTQKDLENQPLTNGLLSFTTDDGKIHLDYVDDDNQLKRKTFYNGKLTFGKYTFDGTSDVNVNIYEGDLED